MKKVLLMSVFALATMTGWCDYYAPEYDGSFVAPTGQTLYYRFNYYSDVVSVSIVAPVRYYINEYFAADYPGWEGYTKPQGMLTIPDSVYTQERGLLPVRDIRAGAFYGCNLLTSVTIPSTVSLIGVRAFYSCSSLDSLIFHASEAPQIYLEEEEVNSTTYQILPFPVTYIIIPCGSYESYASTWQFTEDLFAIRNHSSHTVQNWSYWAPHMVFEETPNITLNATANDTAQGDVGVLLNNLWFYSWAHPEPASCVDSTVIINAFPREGFRFDHWSNGSTANPDTLHLSGDLSLTAYFVAEGVQTYTITVTSANPDMGSATGSGNYNIGSIATLTATANSGYRFVRWNDNNTQNPRTITVTGDATYTAYFEATQGIDDIADEDINVNALDGRIVVETEQDDEMSIYDIVGRKVDGGRKNRFDVPTSGVYLVKVGTLPVRKVVVIK